MLKFDLNICYPQQFCKQFHKTALFSCAERSTKLPPSFSVIIIPAVCIAMVLAASALFLDYVRRSRKKGFYQLPQSAPPSAWGQPWPKRPLVHAATKCVASTHLNLWLSDFFFKCDYHVHVAAAGQYLSMTDDFYFNTCFVLLNTRLWYS